jgi:hypothetical protein
MVTTLVLSMCVGQVNAEVLKPAPWKAGLSLGADGALFLSRGNVVLVDVGGTLRAQWQTLHPADESGEAWVKQRVFGVASGKYAETARGPFLNQTFAHLRWTAMWHPRVGTDVFAQYQTNLFLRMQARAVGGPGIRVEAVRTKHLAVWAGSAVMVEFDRLSPLAGSLDPLETFDVRWSSYLTVRLGLFDHRLLVQNTTYAQPRFDRFTDARFLTETEVMAKVVDALMLGVVVSVLHDTQPPDGVVPTDVRLLTTIRFTVDVAPSS